MKKLLFIILLLILTAPVFAQRQMEMTTTTKDTVIIETGKEKVVIIERRDDGTNTEIVYLKSESSNMKLNRKKTFFTYDWMIEMGYNVYGSRNIFTGKDSGDDFIDQNTSKSVNLALYPFIGSFRPNGNKYFSIQSGIGVDYSNYRFENGMTIENIDGHTVPSFKYIENGESMISKSKFVTSYVNIPLIFRLDIPLDSRRDNIYFAAGVIGGLKIQEYTKVKFYNGDKEHDRDSFNANMFRYSLTFRAGYKCFGLYFNYQMNPMFENNKGPKLYPYCVGFSWMM